MKSDLARPAQRHELALPREPDELGELTDDAVTANYRLWQRKRGHRYSLDDVLTAWEAATTLPQAKRCLDLGSGVGSVPLMLADTLPGASFLAIEAQRNSFALLTRNVHRNGLCERVALQRGDFREVVRADMTGAPFDLITGTPPYIPPGHATPSSDAQRAYARQEYRGGVEAYIAAARPVLAPEGRIVVCADARTPDRVHGAALAHGLTAVRRRDVIPRESHKQPLFSVWTLALASSEQEQQPITPLLWHARDARGARTESYLALRAFFGFQSKAGEPPARGAPPPNSDRCPNQPASPKRTRL